MSDKIPSTTQLNKITEAIYKFKLFPLYNALAKIVELAYPKWVFTSSWSVSRCKFDRDWYFGISTNKSVHLENESQTHWRSQNESCYNLVINKLCSGQKVKKVKGLHIEKQKKKQLNSLSSKITNVVSKKDL